MREYRNYITIPAHETLEIRHEIPRDSIAAANLRPRDKCKASLTDLGLGTHWWMYGTMDEVADKKFMLWDERGVEGYRQYQIDNVDTLGEPMEEMTWEDSSEWIMGEDRCELGIVVEGRSAEFEIVEEVVGRMDAINLT